MVTQYNQEDAINFANYAQSLYDRGMKPKTEPITRSDFRNWKLGKLLSEKEIKQRIAIELMQKTIGSYGDFHTNDHMKIQVTGDGSGIHFLIENAFHKGNDMHRVQHFKIKDGWLSYGKTFSNGIELSNDDNPLVITSN